MISAGARSASHGAARFRCGRAFAVLVATVAALAASAAGSGAQVALAALLILVGGLPHGASDHLVAARRGEPARLVAFFLFYVLVAAATLVLWSRAPGPSLALFLALSVLHFALDDLPGAARERLGERLVRGLLPVTVPALLHEAELARLYAALADPAWGAALAGAGRLAAPPVLLGALAVLWHRHRRGNDGRSAELAVTALALALFPPLVGFALYFALVHSRGRTRERMRELAIPTLAGYLAAVWPTLAGAAMLFAALALAWGGGMAVPLAPLFVGLSALTVPHMMVTPLFERRPPALNPPRRRSAAGARGCPSGPSARRAVRPRPGDSP